MFANITHFKSSLYDVLELQNVGSSLRTVSDELSQTKMSDICDLTIIFYPVNNLV